MGGSELIRKCNGTEATGSIFLKILPIELTDGVALQESPM